MLKLAAGHWFQFRQTRAMGETRAVSAVGFSAVVVLFLAGVFEFDFGDSEVLIVFLFLVSAPYVLNPLSGKGAHHTGGSSHANWH